MRKIRSTECTASRAILPAIPSMADILVFEINARIARLPILQRKETWTEIVARANEEIVRMP